MSSPEELLQQVRDGTLSAQEFADHISALVDQGEKLWTYSDLVGEAFAIEFAIKKDEEKKKAIAKQKTKNKNKMNTDYISRKISEKDKQVEDPTGELAIALTKR